MPWVVLHPTPYPSGHGVSKDPGRSSQVKAWRPRSTAFTLTEDDWAILETLTEPRHIKELPIKIAQRCLHLYKAGYVSTDAEGWIVLSLHGRHELARRQRTAR